MGIPKFFRWLSERYPLINQTVAANGFMPQFDNMYLDMNGIIHPCTHGNDGEMFHLTEDQMFIAVGQFVDDLVKIVRPQKLLFLAVDGPAPRAKINQQRQRRFRAAKELSKSIKAAEEKGEEVPADPFDSNCITPGTTFMARLTEFLHYFICKKVRDDANWKTPKIILSGAEVPGEGEHKIMEYIRRNKSQEDWPPNLRHCIYGNDADLIMLALASHEPHFALLRETVDYRPTKRHNSDGSSVSLNHPKVDQAEKTRSKAFQLLHISILRDYMQLEFSDMKQCLPSDAWDFERIIDDLVLLCYLVGNDFLPTLPGLDIATGGLNDLIAIYKELLPTWGDYLTFLGQVDLARLGQLLSRIGALERDLFQRAQQEMDEFQARSARSNRGKMVREVDTSERFDGSEASVESYKSNYYMKKLGLSMKDVAGHAAIKQKYVEGILWCFSYYYNGCPSWSWFYPFHYTPFASDLVGLEDLEVSFELGKPFFPFQQLLGVLPIASKKLLPEIYATLMDSPWSALNQAGFYPLEFEVDQEGKRNDWEGVVLIPFIDADLLLREYEKVSLDRLTAEERFRNQLGTSKLYTFDTKTGVDIASPISTLPNLIRCPVKCEIYTMPEFPLVNGGRFLPTLSPGVELGADARPGFPSLFSRDIRHELAPCRVSIFGRPSSKDSLLLRVGPPPPERAVGGSGSETELLHTARTVVGKRCLVEWPYLKEARVMSITTSRVRIRVGPNGQLLEAAHSAQEEDKWRREMAMMQSEWLSKYAVEMPEAHAVLEVAHLSGLVRTPQGGLVKQFESTKTLCPLSMVERIHGAKGDGRLEEEGEQAPAARFPVGSAIMLMQKPFVGVTGQVTGHLPGGAIEVEVSTQPRVRMEEELFSHRCIESWQQTFAGQWFGLQDVTARLRVPFAVLNKAAGSIPVKGGGDIGLSFKFEHKGYGLAGYARWNAARNEWELSGCAVELLEKYQKMFPSVFQAIRNDPRAREYEAGSFTGAAADGDADGSGESEKSGATIVEEVIAWIKSLKCYSLPLLPAEAFSLDPECVEKLQAFADQLQCLKAGATVVPKKISVAPTLLLSPVKHGVIDDKSVSGMAAARNWQLGDRAICVSDSGTVPWGSRGTVVAIEPEPGTRLEEGRLMLDLVLDEAVMGANTLQGRCAPMRGYRMHADKMLNLSAIMAPASLRRGPALTSSMRPQHSVGVAPPPASTYVKVLSRPHNMADAAAHRGPPPMAAGRAARGGFGERGGGGMRASVPGVPAVSAQQHFVEGVAAVNAQHLVGGATPPQALPHPTLLLKAGHMHPDGGAAGKPPFMMGQAPTAPPHAVPDHIFPVPMHAVPAVSMLPYAVGLIPNTLPADPAILASGPSHHTGHPPAVHHAAAAAAASQGPAAVKGFARRLGGISLQSQAPPFQSQAPPFQFNPPPFPFNPPPFHGDVGAGGSMMMMAGMHRPAATYEAAGDCSAAHLAAPMPFPGRGGRGERGGRDGAKDYVNGGGGGDIPVSPPAGVGPSTAPLRGRGGRGGAGEYADGYGRGRGDVPAGASGGGYTHRGRGGRGGAGEYVNGRGKGGY